MYYVKVKQHYCILENESTHMTHAHILYTHAHGAHPAQNMRRPSRGAAGGRIALDPELAVGAAGRLGSTPPPRLSLASKQAPPSSAAHLSDMLLLASFCSSLVLPLGNPKVATRPVDPSRSAAYRPVAEVCAACPSHLQRISHGLQRAALATW